MRAAKIFMICATFIFFFGCSDNKSITIASSENSEIVKNLNMRDGDVYFEFYNKINGYALIKESTVKEDDGINKEELLLKGLDAGNYNIIFKYNDKTGEIKRSQSYNFVVKDNTNEVIVDNMEFVGDANGKAEIKMTIAANSNEEIYIKKIETKVFDLIGNEITKLFDMSEAEKPFMLTAGAKGEVLYRTLLDMVGKNVIFDVRVIGCTEKNREIRVLNSKNIDVKIEKKDEYTLNVLPDKKIYVEGDIIKAEVSTTSLKSKELMATYGGEILKLTVNAGEKKYVQFSANRNYKSIIISSNEGTKSVAAIDVIAVEGIDIKYSFSGNIAEGEEGTMQIDTPQYADRSKIVLTAGNSNIKILNQEGNIYNIKFLSAGSGRINVSYNGKIIKTVEIIIAKRAKIVLVDKQANVSGDTISIKGCVVTYTDNLYRFKSFEITGDVFIKENSSSGHELVSKEISTAVISIVLSRKSVGGSGEVYVVYEEIETGEMCKERIF